MPKKTSVQTAGSDKIVTPVKPAKTETTKQLKVVQEPTKAVEKKTPASKTVNATPAPAPAQQGGKGTSSKKRTFKIKISDNEFCSRITGNTPKQAASKALTLIVSQKQQAGKLTKGKIVFTIKETTRGSKGKEYVYQGEKVKLKQPTTYEIRSPNGEVKQIVNKFRNVIEKFTEA